MRPAIWKGLGAFTGLLFGATVIWAASTAGYLSRPERPVAETHIQGDSLDSGSCKSDHNACDSDGECCNNACKGGTCCTPSGVSCSSSSLCCTRQACGDNGQCP